MNPSRTDDADDPAGGSVSVTERSAGPSATEAGTERPRATRRPSPHRARRATAGLPPATGALEWAGLGLLLVAVAVAVIATKAGEFAPDTRPDLYYAPGRFLRLTLQAWVGGGTGLGQANFNTGTAPVAAVVWAIRALGAPAWLAVRLWRLLLLVIGAFGIRRYLGALFGDRLTAPARFGVTVFWVANPYVIVAGSTTPILLPYSLLPWMLLALHRATANPRSWRWPAALALAFAAMSGLNAGVVPLFQLVAVPCHLLYARLAHRVSWRDLVRVLVRCGVLSLAVSIYWLVPSFLARGAGAGIAATTESPRDVARTTSWAESVRLLGIWPLYGRSGDRLFQPSYVAYLTDAVVVAASFLVPVALVVGAWMSRARERLLGALLVGAALPVMVGIFPPDHPPPWGRLVRAVFDRVPASLAFRTTNKLGAVLVIGYAVLLACGINGVVRRRSGRWLRPLAVGIGAVVLIAAAQPMWSANLYSLSYRIPRYWDQATSDLDRGASRSRVLVVPGGTGGNYRWGLRSPDDLFDSLLRRPAVQRNTVVGRGDPAGNFLAGYDGRLASGDLRPGALSAVARYLGASDVLVRNDLLSEEINGPSPASVESQVRSDGGLRLVHRYGRRGENTVPLVSGQPATADTADAALHPLERWSVPQARGVVETASAVGQVAVDGDGEAVPILANLGIVDGRQALRYLGGFDRSDLRAAAADGAHFVLTDTNRRRAWDINRVANAASQTLRADESIDVGNGSTLTLWPDSPDRQSVVRLEGANRLTASAPSFGLRPFGKPDFAFDGDPFTSWSTGELGAARGKRITLEFGRAVRIDSVAIVPSQSSPARVTKVRITVGAEQLDAALLSAPQTVVQIPQVLARSISVQILAASPGDNAVGFAEISVPGVGTTDVVELPRTYAELVAQADDRTRRRVAALPLDVVFQRQRGAAADAGDDEERVVDREFRLPQQRSFSLSASVASLVDLPPPVRDLVLGGAEGKSRCFVIGALDDRPVRASVVTPLGPLAGGASPELRRCGGPVTLDAGVHRFRSDGRWLLDGVRLRAPGRSNSASSAAARPPELTIRRSRLTDQTFAVARADHPYFIRLGQAFDRRWRLLMDGRDLGPPTLVDGYSTGWRIADLSPHRFEAAFPSEGSLKLTFLLSSLALLGVLALAAWPGGGPAWLHRRWLARRRDRGSASDHR